MKMKMKRRMIFERTFKIKVTIAGVQLHSTERMPQAGPGKQRGAVVAAVFVDLPCDALP